MNTSSCTHACIFYGGFIGIYNLTLQENSFPISCRFSSCMVIHYWCHLHILYYLFSSVIVKQYLLQYSGLFSRGKIFANFMNQKRLVKILPLKCILFNRYSLQSVTICENFPLEKLGIAQFAKLFPLENKPLYSSLALKSFSLYS